MNIWLSAVLVLPLFGLVIIFGCISNDQISDTEQNEKVQVVASFYPLYDFAMNVGGERVEITTLIPNGVEPHDFEPSPGDIIALENADIFVYNGAGMEMWIDSLLESTNNGDLIVVDTSESVELIEYGNSEGEEGKYDPHIWLDPVLAKQQVAVIMDALIEADPEGKEYYEQNAEEYMAKLDALDANISTVMVTCKKKDILITHATLAYFCKEYGCNQIPVTGVNPEAEPSAQDIVKIIEQAREQNISVVFFEKLINPATAQTIAEEINGTTMVFNSVHGLTEEEKAAGMDYVSLMEENLDKIREALDCE
jgi:zinc transport system substrate-binding protein